MSFLFGTHVTPLLAQVTPSLMPVIESYEPTSLLKDVIAWAIIAAALLCIVFIFIGGISFILSGGNEEKVKQAVGTIRYAIIGLVVVVISVALVNLLTFIFKVPFKVVDYSEIMTRIRSIGNVFQNQPQGYPSEQDYSQ